MLMLALAAEAHRAGEALDEARWRALVQEHGPFLRRAVARLGARPAAVDDVVQEAFVSAFRRRDDLPSDPGRMRAWLYRAARHHLLHERRGTARRLTRQEAVAAEPAPEGRTPEEQVAAASSVALVHRVLDDLPLDLREAVVLVELEGMSAVDAAALLEIGENTFRSRLRRGRERFLAAWQRHDPGPEVDIDAGQGASP